MFCVSIDKKCPVLTLTLNNTNTLKGQFDKTQ